MLNYLWAGMIAVGVIYGVFTGNIEEVTNGALDSAGEAVELCVAMIGIMAFWTGLMEIAKASGLIASMTKGIQPLISFLFPRIPKGHPAREHISTNIIANILGLGWACTPAGLRAMEALAQLEAERGNTAYMEKDERAGSGSGTARSTARVRVASDEMCTFLILNISSLQLIPVSMIAYRSQYGSVSPTAIVGPAILATLFSTVVGIVFAKAAERKY